MGSCSISFILNVLFSIKLNQNPNGKSFVTVNVMPAQQMKKYQQILISVYIPTKINTYIPIYVHMCACMYLCVCVYDFMRTISEWRDEGSKPNKFCCEWVASQRAFSGYAPRVDYCCCYNWFWIYSCWFVCLVKRMQSVGGCASYLRVYLYLCMFSLNTQFGFPLILHRWHLLSTC